MYLEWDHEELYFVEEYTDSNSKRKIIEDRIDKYTDLR